MVKRNTIQRQMVYATVAKLGHHPTAENVYDEITKEYPDISKGTIYRNLNALYEAGLINCIPVPNAAARYDHILSKHYHMLCSECGEFHNLKELPYDHDLDKNVEQATGFKLRSHAIVFIGLCPECQKKMAEEKEK